MSGSGIVTKAQVADLVRRIARTLEAELDCGDCGKHVPTYVDSILAGDEDGAGDRWAQVRQHLEECIVCSQEFRALWAVAKLDLEGTWPTPEAMLEEVVNFELNA